MTKIELILTEKFWDYPSPHINANPYAHFCANLPDLFAHIIGDKIPKNQ